MTDRNLLREYMEQRVNKGGTVMEYTVYFEQINRTNLQVKADTLEEALNKAEKLYKKQQEIPSADVQEGWLSESDGEDK